MTFEKNTKTVLFASLIAAMILPMSISNATAKTKTVTYDPDMFDYLSKVISNEGKLVEKKTLDGTDYKVVKKVTQVSDNKYKVVNSVFIDGEKQNKDVFKVIKNNDGTLRLVNNNLGIDETFTDNALAAKGIGSSSYSGAVIWLSDDEWGSVNTLNLYDNYSACSTFNQAVMQGDVKTNVVDVTWEASPFYLHSCFYPHQWEHGSVTFESQTHDLDSDSNQSDRKSSHVFTNTLNTYDQYRVDIVFYYGGW